LKPALTAEPWRKGHIESFNSHYEQKVLHKIPMTGYEDLKDAPPSDIDTTTASGSAGWEEKHRTRPSAIKGSI